MAARALPPVNSTLALQRTEARLRRWLQQEPERLLQRALAQGQRLIEQHGQLEALRAQNQLLADQLHRANGRISELEGALEEAQRAAHRQAAPFRIEDKKRSAAPKKPGRKAGHPGAFRRRPDHIDEEIEVKLCACPHCGGTRFEGQRPIEQFIEDIPLVKPHVTQLRTYEATCAGCGEQVRSTHAFLQMSLAEGAAGVQMGPRAVALGADLNKGKKLSMRKTCEVLRVGYNFKVTPGGLSQAMDRMARRLERQHQEHIAQIRSSPVVHIDETSWWVGGPGWWLWVFTNQDGTLYHVSQSRGRDVVFEMLGRDYAGVLVSDCLATYDDVNPLQHKCYSHHHQAITKAIQAHPNPEEAAAGYLGQLRKLLQAANALGKQKPEIPPEHFALLRQRLKEQADDLLETPRAQTQEESVRNRLFKQRDHLFTFLDHDGVDATNNLAERQLRPAVISRKISCGNKTAKGARTWAILASLAATCDQKGNPFVDSLARAAPLQPQGR